MASVAALKETYTQLKTRMEKAVEDFRRELTATRTGRASVNMLDTVHVECYGSSMPLNQIAQVHAPDPQMITVQPFDPGLMSAIERPYERRARAESDERRQDGARADPALTGERRKELVKHISKVLEEHRTAVRNIRRDGNEAIKKAMKDKKITEDEERGSLDQMQKLTDDEIKKMEEMSKAKEKEVMQV